jgi:hypothetical protein
MRARITEFTSFTPTMELRGADGKSMRVARGVEMRLSVTAVAEGEDISRLMDAGGEIILAPIPFRRTDGVTESTLTMWADYVAKANNTPAPEMLIAVQHLLPEVISLRREVEALRRAETSWRRSAESQQEMLRKMQEALDAIATHCAVNVEPGDRLDPVYLRTCAEKAGGHAEDFFED